MRFQAMAPSELPEVQTRPNETREDTSAAFSGLARGLCCDQLHESWWNKLQEAGTKIFRVHLLKQLAVNPSIFVFRSCSSRLCFFLTPA